MTKRQPWGGKSPVALPWNPLPHMEEFLDNHRAGGETTEAYIKAAKLGLSHYATFLATQNVQHPDEIERHHILRFQAHLMTLTSSQSGKPLTLAYRQQLMKYVRTWTYWCMELGYITGNPWVRIKVGTQTKKPKPLEDEEINALFEAHTRTAFVLAPFYYHRRETILTLLYGWGLRIHELQALTVAQMDMRQNYVTCRNKGGGEKVLPYAEEIKAIVIRWLNHRSGKAMSINDSLLIDTYGRQMSIPAIRKVITDLGDRAGVPINPHRLRDSFGTKLLESDVPVERIMKMMGHTQRAQTLAYARVNDHTLKSSHDAVMAPLLRRLTNAQPADLEETS